MHAIRSSLSSLCSQRQELVSFDRSPIVAVEGRKQSKYIEIRSILFGELFFAMGTEIALKALSGVLGCIFP